MKAVTRRAAGSAGGGRRLRARWPARSDAPIVRKSLTCLRSETQRAGACGRFPSRQAQQFLRSRGVTVGSGRRWLRSSRSAARTVPARSVQPISCHHRRQSLTRAGRLSIAVFRADWMRCSMSAQFARVRHRRRCDSRMYPATAFPTRQGSARQLDRRRRVRMRGPPDRPRRAQGWSARVRLFVRIRLTRVNRAAARSMGSSRILIFGNNFAAPTAHVLNRADRRPLRDDQHILAPLRRNRRPQSARRSSAVAVHTDGPCRRAVDPSQPDRYFVFGERLGSLPNTARFAVQLLGIVLLPFGAAPSIPAGALVRRVQS